MYARENDDNYGRPLRKDESGESDTKLGEVQNRPDRTGILRISGVHDYILQWKLSHEFTDSDATRKPTNTHVRHDTHIFVEWIYYLQVGRAARLKTLLQ